MSKKSKNNRYILGIRNQFKRFVDFKLDLWRNFGKVSKFLFVLSALSIFGVLLLRSIAWHYQKNNADIDYEFGTTFISGYAENLGVNPKVALPAILNDLNIDNVRLVSYWNEIESNQGEYDFSDLDWQFSEAEIRGVEVSLSLGLRQPRYPECHMPTWAENLASEEWYAHLNNFISKVVERYKDRPNLKSYQLENEFFLEAFGECNDFNRERLIDEHKLVKRLDPDTPVILSRSNNYGGFAIGEPRPDIVGISVYRRVHNKTFGYITYPFPAWYYALLAQGQLSLTGTPSVIHEFQLEPWLASGDLHDASTEEQNKTMSVEQVKKNIDFAKRTGIKEIYFWGAEWWYARAEQGDPSIWNEVKSGLSEDHL